MKGADAEGIVCTPDDISRPVTLGRPNFHGTAAALPSSVMKSRRFH
jgi:hypothetical protein